MTEHKLQKRQYHTHHTQQHTHTNNTENVTSVRRRCYVTYRFPVDTIIRKCQINRIRIYHIGFFRSSVLQYRILILTAKYNAQMNASTWNRLQRSAAQLFPMHCTCTTLRFAGPYYRPQDGVAQYSTPRHTTAQHAHQSTPHRGIARTSEHGTAQHGTSHHTTSHHTTRRQVTSYQVKAHQCTAVQGQK
jgi:hypothetical protein